MVRRHYRADGGRKLLRREDSSTWAGAPPGAPHTPTPATTQAGQGNRPFSTRCSVGSLLHPTLPGCGACRHWGLPLTVVPASSTLIYGAIWCQVIAHQYPIYHPACHGLWLLFHKAKAFEKGPVTQSTGRGRRKCHMAKFFSPLFASHCSAFHRTSGGAVVCSPGRELLSMALLWVPGGSSCPSPASPPYPSQINEFWVGSRSKICIFSRSLSKKKKSRLIDWKEICQNTDTEVDRKLLSSCAIFSTLSVMSMYLLKTKYYILYSLIFEIQQSKSFSFSFKFLMLFKCRFS